MVSLGDAQAAAMALDGAWWDSARRIPDWMLVQRRRMDTGPVLQPWTLAVGSAGAKGAVKPLAACSNAGPPLALHIAEGWNGMAFRDLATLEFDVGDGIVAEGFPFSRTGSRVVTQDDFPAVIAVIRRANAEVFGEAGDRP